MGQVCDENISLPVESNAPTPSQIPSFPGKSHPHQKPATLGTRTQETPAPGTQPEGGGLQNMRDGNLPCPAPTGKNAGEGTVTHPDELR